MTTAQYRKRPRVEGEEGINEAVQLGLVATGEDAIHCPLLATVAVLAPSSAGSSLELESKFEYSPAVTGIRASLVQSAHAREQLRSLGEFQVKQAREQRNAVQQQLQQFEREVSMLNTAAAPKRIDEELPRPGLGWVEPGVTEAPRARAVERPKASTKQTTAATTTTTAAASNDELLLEDLLSPEWLDAIGPVLRAQVRCSACIDVAEATCLSDQLYPYSRMSSSTLASIDHGRSLRERTPSEHWRRSHRLKRASLYSAKIPIHDLNQRSALHSAMAL